MDLIQILLSLIFFSSVRGDSDDDADYHDLLLDHTTAPFWLRGCFEGVMPSLLSELETVYQEDRQFCSLAADSLRCAANLNNNDGQKDGASFDSWLRTLQAIKDQMCKEGGKFIRDIASKPCFNINEFFDCVEAKVGISHVVDLLMGQSREECQMLFIALPTCNMRANTAHLSCYSTQDKINEVIFTFFNQSDCGRSYLESDSVYVSPTPYLVALLVLTLLCISSGGLVI